jgi:hypothetical protein
MLTIGVVFQQVTHAISPQQGAEMTPTQGARFQLIHRAQMHSFSRPSYNPNFLYHILQELRLAREFITSWTELMKGECGIFGYETFVTIVVK